MIKIEPPTYNKQISGTNASQTLEIILMPPKITTEAATVISIANIQFGTS